MGKIGVVSDMHLKESLGYADYVSDRREGERKEVLEAIVSEVTDRGADRVVLLGDMLNSRNNPASVIRDYVQFLESFPAGVRIHVMVGNHEKGADGRSAVDFVEELRDKPDWHLVRTGPVADGGLVFLPYMHKEELGLLDSKEASARLTSSCLDLTAGATGKRILFAHHCLSGTVTEWGQSVDAFDEPVLDRKALEDGFDLVVGGHLHSPQDRGRTRVVGSVFANEAGEGVRRMLLVDDETAETESLWLPGRTIVRVDDPKCDEKIHRSSIVRAVVTKRTSERRMAEIREWLRGFDGHLLVDMRNRKRSRKKAASGGVSGLSLERLVEMWAEERELDPKPLLEAFREIRDGT